MYAFPLSGLTPRQVSERLEFVREIFELRLRGLGLYRQTAPLFLQSSLEINDSLSGELPVSFETSHLGILEIPNSLAIWKRLVLSSVESNGKQLYSVGEGLYTVMNAIRPHEKPDKIHSIYVDQYDWERVINQQDRNSEYLKKVVRSIYGIFFAVNETYSGRYGKALELPRDITFITSEELLQMYPSLPPKEREHEFAREVGAYFLMQIGMPLSNGVVHDKRSADYDDWSLNGDIIIHSPLLGGAVELSSMGIRVDWDTYCSQKYQTGPFSQYTNLSFYERLLKEEKLAYTIGGGIGQSRLCALIMGAIHIGQVQASVWPKDQHEIIKSGGGLIIS